MKASNNVAKVSFVLVSGLSGISFVLSYVAIQQMAISTGAVTGWLSYLVPFVVDGAMMVFSFSALRKSLSDESIFSDMVLVLLATVCSVAFNVLHAPREYVSVAIAALPPIALFLSFERVMGMVRDTVKKSGLVSSIEELTQKQKEGTEAIRDSEEKVNSLQSEVSALIEDRNQYVSQCKQLESQCKQLETERYKLENTLANKGTALFTDDQLLALYSELPKLAHSKAADVLGVTRPAVTARLKALEASGTIHRNGQGVELQSKRE